MPPIRPERYQMSGSLDRFSEQVPGWMDFQAAVAELDTAQHSPNDILVQTIAGIRDKLAAEGPDAVVHPDIRGHLQARLDELTEQLGAESDELNRKVIEIGLDPSLQEGVARVGMSALSGLVELEGVAELLGEEHVNAAKGPLVETITVARTFFEDVGVIGFDTAIDNGDLPLPVAFVTAATEFDPTIRGWAAADVPADLDLLQDDRAAAVVAEQPVEVLADDVALREAPAVELPEMGLQEVADQAVVLDSTTGVTEVTDQAEPEPVTLDLATRHMMTPGLEGTMPVETHERLVRYHGASLPAAVDPVRIIVGENQVQVGEGAFVSMGLDQVRTGYKDHTEVRRRILELIAEAEPGTLVSPRAMRPTLEKEGLLDGFTDSQLASFFVRFTVWAESLTDPNGTPLILSTHTRGGGAGLVVMPGVELEFQEKTDPAEAQARMVGNLHLVAEQLARTGELATSVGLVVPDRDDIRSSDGMPSFAEFSGQTDRILAARAEAYAQMIETICSPDGITALRAQIGDHHFLHDLVEGLAEVALDQDKLGYLSQLLGASVSQSVVEQTQHRTGSPIDQHLERRVVDAFGVEISMFGAADPTLEALRDDAARLRAIAELDSGDESPAMLQLIADIEDDPAPVERPVPRPPRGLTADNIHHGKTEGVPSKIFPYGPDAGAASITKTLLSAGLDPNGRYSVADLVGMSHMRGFTDRAIEVARVHGVIPDEEYLTFQEAARVLIFNRGSKEYGRYDRNGVIEKSIAQTIADHTAPTTEGAETSRVAGVVVDEVTAHDDGDHEQAVVEVAETLEVTATEVGLGGVATGAVLEPESPVPESATETIPETTRLTSKEKAALRADEMVSDVIRALVTAGIDVFDADSRVMRPVAEAQLRQVGRKFRTSDVAKARENNIGPRGEVHVRLSAREIALILLYTQNTDFYNRNDGVIESILDQRLGQIRTSDRP